MAGASTDIKDILEAESSLGLSFGDDLVIGLLPTSPDSCVAIMPTSGPGPDLTFNTDEKYMYPSVQIQVRKNASGTGFTDAEDLMYSIKDLLHGRANETWNGSRYIVVVCTTEPAVLKYDENNRVIFFANFEMQREPN